MVFCDSRNVCGFVEIWSDTVLINRYFLHKRVLNFIYFLCGVVFMYLNCDCSFRISVFGSHCSGLVRLADCIVFDGLDGVSERSIVMDLPRLFVLDGVSECIDRRGLVIG